MLYREHLVMGDRFSRDRPNLGQTLIENPLYSGDCSLEATVLEI